MSHSRPDGRRRGLRLAAAFVLGATALAVPLLSSQPPERVLDVRRAPYVEDEPGGRFLAAITARLLEDAGGSLRLELDVSAVGGEVVPAPGLRGVHGGNAITARELARLLEDGRIEFGCEAGDGVLRAAGACWPGRRGRLLERRVDPRSGRVVERLTPRPGLLSMVASTPVPRAGEATSGELFGVIRVDGRERLRVAIDDPGGRGAARLGEIVSEGPAAGGGIVR